MDDSCAVCADALEWVAYGSCGHREVCSTCVVRIRFVLDDHRCCICKSDNSIVFITKAMGDYTRVITDFSLLPAGGTEGKAGAFWYHEGTHAYFDDADHYRMIKDTCRLSCSVCDKSAAAAEQGSEGGARKKAPKFKSIEQLKGHLFHQHRLFMCSLCLEGRKVFICEQKLYTRSQLNQHINTGDSEVDGSESDRGGFMGHPMCEFCRSPFYGDNELYVHMSTEHYTCHVCQRQHPGQYDYYKNYDDLEIHFRQEHFLCEDDSCLAKKFIVFQTEAEMKRHNTLEHGGHMSRSKRNAALQIPTSFRYRRGGEQDQRRGRGRGGRADEFGIEFTMDSATADARSHDSSSGARTISDLRETSLTGAFASLATDRDAESPISAAHTQSSRNTLVIEESSFPPLSDREPPEPSARYAQALQISKNAARLGEESFPPLPAAEKNSKPRANRGTGGLHRNIPASRFQIRNLSSAATRSSAWSKPSENHDIGTSRSASFQIRPATDSGTSSSTSAISHPRKGVNQGSSSCSPAVAQVKQMRENENELMPFVSAHSPWNSNAVNGMRHCASAPNLTGGGPSNHTTSSIFSTVGGNQTLPTSGLTLPDAKEVQTANKSLVERIRAGLGMDDNKFAAFKNISSEYRDGVMNTWEYLSYVEQFGLSHLVLELAWLCPDAQKQKELIDAFSANLRVNAQRENGGSSAVTSKEGKKRKGKGKIIASGDSSSATDALTDSILDTVRKLQSNIKHQQEEVETLSKDGYRTASTKLQPLPKKSYANPSSSVPNLGDSSSSRETPTNTTSSNQNVNGGGSRQKKSSKFHRIRLGDGSASAFLDPGRSNVSPERQEKGSSSDPQKGLPVRGVWRNGGGLRIVAKSQKNSSK